MVIFWAVLAALGGLGGFLFLGTYLEMAVATVAVAAEVAKA